MGLSRAELVTSRADWAALAARVHQSGAAHALLGRARAPGGGRLLISRLCEVVEDRPPGWARADLLEVVPAASAEQIQARLTALAGHDQARPVLITLAPRPAAWHWAGRGRPASQLARLCVVGSAGPTTPVIDHYWAAEPPPADMPTRLQRQLAALGHSGQQRLRQLTVAVAGCGGTGGMVAQQLALIGVGRLVLIDPDQVEESNRNRLVGATFADAARGAAKVDVLRRYLRCMAPDTELVALARSLYDTRASQAILGADVLIGCTDNEGSRLHMNALAVQYLLPYIDCGVGIIRHAERLEAGGQVRTVLPGGPCLECYGGIDRWRAADDLAAPYARELRRAYGYGLGAGQPALALAPLNAAIAAEAAAATVALATGLREQPAFLAYDFLGTRLLARDDARRSPGCLACAPGRRYGRGDSLPLPRPAADLDWRELPAAPALGSI